MLLHVSKLLIRVISLIAVTIFIYIDGGRASPAELLHENNLHRRHELLASLKVTADHGRILPSVVNRRHVPQRTVLKAIESGYKFR